MDAVSYRVHSISAPTDEERARHYLWRFWRRLPRAGRVAIFDRSWYGRVLVERVEGFASESAWRRSYAEINDFEEQILDSGAVLLKFWIHIDAEEQLRRFKVREEIPFKKYKITSEDYRNRDRRFDYEAAAAEMLARTHTAEAPWFVVPGVDKKWARLEILARVNEALRAAVK
jgi:polyphosphate kinase 2 (PPK2 family)